MVPEHLTLDLIDEMSAGRIDQHNKCIICFILPELLTLDLIDEMPAGRIDQK